MTQAPEPLILGELPASEAQGILEAYVGGQPERVAAFLAEVGSRGGPDEVAHRQERRIDRLVEWLPSEAGIAEAIHEDREVVLLRAPGPSASELEALVAALWKARSGRSHAVSG